MSDRERRHAFALVAALVTGLVVVLAWVVPETGEPAPGGAADRAEGSVGTRALGVPRRRATVQDPTVNADADDEESASPPSEGPTALPGDDEDLPLGVEPPPRPVGTLAAVKRHARRFLDAFFRYEIGDLSAGVRAQLRAHASPELARALFEQPPRPPRGVVSPQRATLVGFDGTDPAPGGGYDVIVLVKRGDQRSTLVVTVERRADRWRATAVG